MFVREVLELKPGNILFILSEPGLLEFLSIVAFFIGYEVCDFQGNNCQSGIAASMARRSAHSMLVPGTLGCSAQPPNDKSMRKIGVEP